MFRQPSFLFTPLIAFIAVQGMARACEDDHPPIVSTPTNQFKLLDRDGQTVMAMATDPRGVSVVVPAGDDANLWIDPRDATGAWHYREWQWWKGHPWGDSCRPRYYSELEFATIPGPQQGASISYRIDGFDCRQIFLVPEKFDDPSAPYWDLVTTVRNISGQDVGEYGQFFACYTPLNRRQSFWYWDESNELVLFSDRGVGHLDGYIAHPLAYFAEQGSIPHCPRGGGKIVGRWRQPVLVSHASPAGWRSIIMIEPQYAAGLAQGIEGKAMDYILFPGPNERTFENGAQFEVHIRHVMLKSRELPTMEQLEELFESFEHAHAEIHQSASRL